MARAPKDATRLVGIMMMFLKNNEVTRSQLIEQFAVTERTIYRDLGALRDMKLIQSLEGETYKCTPAAELLKQSGLLRSFADFVDVSKFLPMGRGDFWHKLPARMDEKHIVITTPSCEESVREDLRQHFSLLEKAIHEHRRCKLLYKHKFRKIEPYRLFYLDGVWYLALTEQKQLKTFRLSGLEWPELLPETFTPNPTIDAILIQQKNAWCSEEQTVVTISVAPEVADYFGNQQHLPEQEIIESCTDGSLLLTTRISHQKQLFPVIRYWLPHLRIVAPEEWQQQLEEDLRTALDLTVSHYPNPPTQSDI